MTDVSVREMYKASTEDEVICIKLFELLKKIKLTPASKLLNTRIRVSNFQKFMLLPSALLFSLFMRKT